MSFTIQSVSLPSVVACRSIFTGPAIVTGSFSTSLVKRTMSARASSGVWSTGPAIVGDPQQLLPPVVGTGSFGS